MSNGCKMSRRGVLMTALGSAMMLNRSYAAITAPTVDRVVVPRLPRRGDFIIHGAHVMTMDPATGDLADADIHVKDGTIVAIGRGIAARGAERIDGAGMIALPGFIDTHFHLWSSVLRSDPESYFPLTLRVGPLYSPLDSYRSVLLGVAESLQSGVTTIHDWSHNILSPAHADAEIRALRDAGIRARFSYGWGQDLAPERSMDMADMARVKQQWFADSPLVSLGVAMRTPVAYQRGNVPMDVLKQDWQEARRLGLPITIHNRAGAVTLLEESGLLGPDVLIVHPQAFTATEINALAARGVSISSSPFGENRNGAAGPRGPVQFAELTQAAVQQSLSTDEVVTNGKADFFAVMREVLRVYSQRPGEQKMITPRRALELATIDGARALGLDQVTGSLTPGKSADITLVRTTDINMTPLADDPASTIVLSAEPSNVDTVIVDGRVLVRKGRFTALDVERVVSDANQSARELRLRDSAKPREKSQS